MTHPTLPTSPITVGQLEEVDATKYKPGLALIHLLTNRMSPNAATNLLIMAIVDHIDLLVKEESQLAVAEGIARSIIANIQQKDRLKEKPKKRYPKIMKKLSQLGVMPALAIEIVSDAKSGNKQAISLVRAARGVKL